MWKAKYIIHAERRGPAHFFNEAGMTPIVFPEFINHSDMARNMGWKREDIVGAGFVYIDDDSYTCYGESVSLRVKSRVGEDDKILNRYLGGRQVDI